MGAVALLAACGSGSSPKASSGSAATPPPTGAPIPGTGPSPATVAVPANWTTYQHDAARTGTTADHIGATAHREWTSPKLDGAVYAQPLLIGSGVIVATEGDSLYRLDAATGAIQWRSHLGTPVSGNALPCGNIDPVGITGTPVIDTAAGLVWAVAFVQPHEHELVAVDLATGAERGRRPVDPPGADPLVQSERAALTLANGLVYVAFGGRFGDCGLYHGWVVATPATVGAVPAPHMWEVPTKRGAGLWAPSGGVVDAGGTYYVTTGNSFTVAASDYDDSNSVIALSPTLEVAGTFAPTDWAARNGDDADLGSIGPTLVGGGLLFQAGKTGVGYLMAADHLGGVGGALQQGPVCSGSGAYGATAWSAPLVLVPCKDGLVAVSVRGQTFAVAWRGPRESSGPPVVTDGMVWTVDLGSGQLVGLDLATGAVRVQVTIGHVPHFASPGVGGGRLVVPSGQTVVAVTG
jgi:outer membrane protein assembly factor BamB